MEEVKKRRIAEATECLRKAEAHLKTSIVKMKFKPDYDSAALEYDRAAICFKNAAELKSSREAYLKAAEIHRKNGNLFHWAKCCESVAMICRDLGDSEGALKYMEQAADGYAESGSSDTSAMALDKAAKCLEEIDLEKAIKIYHKALTMVQQTDCSRMANEFVARLTRLYLKLQRYKEAADTISEEIERCVEIKEAGRVGQLTVALVLIQLACDDSVAATKSLENSYKCAGFEISEDANVCSALISAYESGDNNRFQQVLRQPLLRSMDNEYLRLMKTLKVGPDVNCGFGRASGNDVYETEDEDLR